MSVLTNIDFSKYSIVIVGSGLFGLTVARLFVEEFRIPALIIEKRNHPGGNSWSEIDSETGIEFHAYGSHLFHTSNQRVWDFVRRFTEFTNYRHKVIAKHNNKFFNVPINLQTISQFFDYPFSPMEAKAFFSKLPRSNESGTSFDQLARENIGDELYQAFFLNYTAKQWQTDPKLLSGEIFRRIPIRLDFNNDYFDDKFQGLPKLGYSEFIKSLLNHPLLHVSLNTDFFDVRKSLHSRSLIVYTGPVDKYFNYSRGVLGWRTLDFEKEIVGVDDFQGTAVVNYVDSDVNFTRIHEFKHLHPERNYPKGKTLIMREFSRFARIEDEPYYPINTTEDRMKLSNYRELMRREKGVFFGGRLGTYQYLDMHMAIASAMNLFYNTLIDYFHGSQNPVT